MCEARGVELGAAAAEAGGADRLALVQGLLRSLVDGDNCDSDDDEEEEEEEEDDEDEEDEEEEEGEDDGEDEEEDEEDLAPPALRAVLTATHAGKRAAAEEAAGPSTMLLTREALAAHRTLEHSRERALSAGVAVAASKQAQEAACVRVQAAWRRLLLRVRFRRKAARYDAMIPLMRSAGLLCSSPSGPVALTTAGRRPIPAAADGGGGVLETLSALRDGLRSLGDQDEPVRAGTVRTLVGLLLDRASALQAEARRERSRAAALARENAELRGALEGGEFGLRRGGGGGGGVEGQVAELRAALSMAGRVEVELKERLAEAGKEQGRLKGPDAPW